MKRHKSTTLRKSNSKTIGKVMCPSLFVADKCGQSGKIPFWPLIVQQWYSPKKMFFHDSFLIAEGCYSTKKYDKYESYKTPI